MNCDVLHVKLRGNETVLRSMGSTSCNSPTDADSVVAFFSFVYVCCFWTLFYLCRLLAV